MASQNKNSLLIVLAVLVVIGGFAAFNMSKRDAAPTADTAITTTDTTPADGAAVVTDTAAPAADPYPVTPSGPRDPAALSVADLMQEKALGNPNAPVKVVEYASFTCSHCTDFHIRTFNQIKMAYIDTGKVYWIYREFPLDNIALNISKVTRCAPNEKYFNLVDVIFHNRDRWITSQNPMGSIASYAKLAGVSDELFQACSTNEELETAILRTMGEAQTVWKVQATPTFVINDGFNMMSGSLEFSEYAKAFDAALAAKGAQ